MSQVAMIARLIAVLVARLIAVLVAVVGAFVGIPYAASILLVLGALASFAIEEDQRLLALVATIVLVEFGGGVSVIPVVGGYLAAILGGLGLAYLGASLTLIVTALAKRLMP